MGLTSKKREVRRQWELKNAEKRREYMRQWRQVNREEKLARKKDYYAKNALKAKDRNFRKQYGMTLADFHAMLHVQGGACAICDFNVAVVASDGFRRAVIDHCHKTGKVRGILCSECNTVLGMAHDSVDVLISAAKYLEGGA